MSAQMTPNEYAAKHKLNPKSVRRKLRALYGKAGDGSHKHSTAWQLTPAMIAALAKPTANPARSRATSQTQSTSPRRFGTNVEKIRSAFRPSRIDVLFVGESAPTGGTFFFKGDSSAFREMQKAFGKHFGRALGDDEFLAWFKKRSCFLDDLVLKPIDKEERKKRRDARQASVAGLASRIAAYQPKSVVAIAKSIDKHVKEALRLSGVGADYHCVSFPGNGQQGNFQIEMEVLLPKLTISA